MFDDPLAENRWAVRLLKIGVFAMAATIVVWYAMHFRAPPSFKPKSPAQQVAILRDRTERAMTRRTAAEAIGRADASIVSELTAELSDGDAVGRQLAALALGRLRVDQAAVAGALVAALKDRAPDVRDQALVALRQLDACPRQVTQALVEQAGNSSAEVRRWAASELGRDAADDQDALQALRACAGDADAHVRAEALAALAHRSAMSVAELISSLHDADGVVRSRACTLLGRMGGEAAPALPELAALIAANDISAASAGHALQTIGKTSPDILAPLLDHEDRRVVGNAARSIFWSPRVTAALREPLFARLDDPEIAEYLFPVPRRMGPERQLRPPQLLDASEESSDAVFSLMLQDDNVLRECAYAMPRHAVPLQQYGYGVSDQDLKRLAQFPHLRLLDLSANPIGDAGLAEVAVCEELEWLLLYRTKVTSAGLAGLAKLKRLRTLGLGGCGITDDGLQHLQELPSLEAIDLRRTQVTDAGMRALAGCPKLKAIWLGQTKVTDAGLSELSELPLLEDLGYPTAQFSLRRLARFKGLRSLRPNRKSVVDEDLALLVDMPRLRELVLSKSGVTDAGIVHLAKLTQLESLSLNDTKITDNGLTKLRSLKNLQFLHLANTRTTEQGLRALQQALPKLKSRLVPNAVPEKMRKASDDFAGLK